MVLFDNRQVNKKDIGFMQEKKGRKLNVQQIELLNNYPDFFKKGKKVFCRIFNVFLRDLFLNKYKSISW